ncbi:MAG: ABC-2 type transport system permease protein [Candidatus Paceibacteria bacterium]|jgi:ABC-2 type transport system permease protein
MSLNKNTKKSVLLLSIVIGVNLVSSYAYKRFDLTQDQRYTISIATKKMMASIENPFVIEVLLEGDFPSEFKKLQAETQQLLAEFSSFNKNISYSFSNPLAGGENTTGIQKQLFQMGIMPTEVEVSDNGKVTQERLYPWALAYYNGTSVKIPLLKNTLGATTQERTINSIQNLEYAFANAFRQLVTPKTKTIAFLKGNGELEDAQIASFLKTIRPYYGIAPFILDSVASNPERTLGQLLSFDLIVIAKPTEAFTDAEKYVLDQYIMNGGASLWLLDGLAQKTDPDTGKTYLIGRDLGLGDLFFKYGARIQPTVIRDVYSAPIVLAQGTENDSQYNQYPWFYYPLSSSASGHPIVSNIEGVKFEYPSPITLLENGIKKTILLSSSPISATETTPHEVNFDSAIPANLKTINQGPNLQEFAAGELPLAVLLEGRFTSALRNRVKPFNISEKSIRKDESLETKMVLVSDGDIITNQFDKGRPLPTGFDKMTQTMYGNNDFLLNTVNFLLDDTGLINIRTKKISIPFLDPQKVQESRSLWQGVHLVLPLVALGIFGFLFTFLRKKKYQH